MIFIPLSICTWFLKISISRNCFFKTFFVYFKLDFYCLCSLKKSSSKIEMKNQFREIEILENQVQIYKRNDSLAGIRKYRPLHVCHEHVFRTLMIVILMIASRVMTIRTTIVQPYHQTISYIFSRSFWHKPTHCGLVM